MMRNFKQIFKLQKKIFDNNSKKYFYKYKIFKVSNILYKNEKKLGMI